MTKRSTSVLSMDEVHSQYSGRLVLVRVVKRDEFGLPLRGIVDDFWEEDDVDNADLDRRLDAAARSGKPYYLTYAGPRLRSGPEYAAAVEELVRQIRGVIGGPRASRV